MQLDEQDIEAFQIIYNSQKTGMVGGIVLSIVFALIPVAVRIFVPENFTTEMVACFIILILCTSGVAFWMYKEREKFAKWERANEKIVITGKVQAFHRGDTSSRVVEVNGNQYIWGKSQNNEELESLKPGDSIRIHTIGRGYVLRAEKL